MSLETGDENNSVIEQIEMAAIGLVAYAGMWLISAELSNLSLTSLPRIWRTASGRRGEGSLEAARPAPLFQYLQGERPLVVGQKALCHR